MRGLSLHYACQRVLRDVSSRSFISPLVQQTMAQISSQYARQMAGQLANSSNVANILANAPQLIIQPVSFTLVNLRPFDVPVYVSALATLSIV